MAMTGEVKIFAGRVGRLLTTAPTIKWTLTAQMP